MITKISLNENEVFSIKGLDGENYIFDGKHLFLDNNSLEVEQEDVFNVSVIKSLRTKSGAESWLKVAGFKYDNAQIVDTDTLKSYGVDYSGENKYHVINADMRDENVEDLKDLIASEKSSEGLPPLPSILPGPDGEVVIPSAPEDGEDTDGSMARAQLRSILDDAEELHSMIRDRDDLEPWVQAKITKAADYLSMLHGYLEHYVMAGELDIEDFLQKAMTTTDAEMSDNSTVDNNADADVVPDGATKGMEETDEETATEDGGEETAEEGADKSMKSMHEEEEEEEEEEEDSMKSMEDENKDGDTVNVHIDTDEHEFGNTEKSIAGTVFKSMHAAKQWNKYENPDKDRYYIDILRTKDRRDPWTRSLGMNAKYIVRDREDDPQPESRGAYGNRIHRKG
jgi:hypothetical protein